MEGTYTLTSSKPLIRKAVRTYVLRKLGIGYLLALLLLLGFFIEGYIINDRSWHMGMIGAILGFAILLPIGIIIQRTQVALKKLTDMQGTPATMSINDNGILIQSPLGSSELHWKLITQVWRYPQFWILLSGKQILMTMPLTDIDDKGRAFIQAAFEKASVKFA